MKKLINTIKNIWEIEELKDRILYTLLLLLIFRIGTYVALPGVNPVALKEAIAAQGGNKGILGLLNTFAGGAFYRAGIFALGIMPYISASIVMQLLTLVVPQVKKIQQEGESGRKLINQYTRILTILITAVQAFAYVKFLRQTYPQALVDIDPTLFFFSTLATLIAGTLFVMWLGEKITDRGIGNGVSLLITVGIIAGLPGALMSEATSKATTGGGLLVFLIELLVLFGIVVLTIGLVQATRKIPVQHAKRMVGRGGRAVENTGARNFIPLKLNASGVMPIIFAQALMFLPSTIASALGQQNTPLVQALSKLGDMRSWQYNVLSFFLVIIFTYFYTALIMRPKEMSEDLKRQGAFVPGIRPGDQTTSFIENILDRITLPGSIFLGIIAILPAFAMIAGVQNNFAIFFGGTSLLIMVAVVLDTLQQIESHLLMRHYDGLMESGKMREQGVGASI